MYHQPIVLRVCQWNYRTTVDEYYQDAQTLEAAKPIRWETGQKVTLPEVRLAELPLIKGRVTFIDGRQPIYAFVRTWKLINNEWTIAETGQVSSNLTTGDYQRGVRKGVPLRMEKTEKPAKISVHPRPKLLSLPSPTGC